MSRFPSVLLFVVVLAGLHFNLTASVPNPSSHPLSHRQQQPWQAPPADPEDFHYIKKWAAIGDSYAAGIGSGKVLQGPGDASCSRYDNSYSSFINDNVQFGYGKDRKFQYLACSGSTSPQALKTQVPKLQSGLELITLSSGGNDVGLSDLLDACVFQWSIPGTTAKCETQLKKTTDLISKTLPGNLDKLYAAVKPKLASYAKTYVTGYAKFFDTTTNACDQVTWAFIYADQKQHLTQARRRKLNDLVDAANGVIRAAVKKAGSQFVFVDYDQYFSLLEGGFCSPSVKEPDPNRQETLFFEWDTSSTVNSLDDRDVPLTGRADIGPSQATLSNGTEESQIDAWIKEALAQSPPANSHELLAVPGNVDISIIPDRYTKAFHPTPQGHAIIAKLVLWKMSEDRSKTLHVDTVSEIDPAPTVCIPDSTPSATATPAAPSTAAAPKNTPACVQSKQTYTQSVNVNVGKGFDAIQIFLPITDHTGGWSLNFGHSLPGTTNDIANWRVAANIVGRSSLWPLAGGNKPPTGVTWSKDSSTEKTFIEFEFKGSATHSFNFAITGTVDCSLPPPPPPPPPVTPFHSGFISPSKFDGTIDCAERDDGAGADTTSTFWTAGSLQVQGQVLGPNIQICTTDVSKCLAHGDSTDGKTPGTTFSSWCLVYASGKTGFVIADKNHGFSGAPGHSCINGAQMTKLGVWAANNCRGGSKVVDVAGGGAKGDGAGVSNNGQWQQTLCIVNTDHPEVCIS